MVWLLVLAGIGLVFISSVFTGMYRRRAALDHGRLGVELGMRPGSGVVPGWVSGLNLLGFGLLIGGAAWWVWERWG